MFPRSVNLIELPSIHDQLAGESVSDGTTLGENQKQMGGKLQAFLSARTARVLRVVDER